MATLRDTFEGYTNDQLLEVLGNREDYTEEAITMVEALIEERGIDEQVIQHSLEKIEQIKREQEVISNEPLSLRIKILLIIFPFIGFLGVSILQTYFHEKGFEQKKADVPKYIMIGVVVWMGVIYWLT